MARRRLPDRRASELIDFELDGKHYVAQFSRFPDDGQLAEVFINNSKSTSDLDTIARDASIVFSIAVQYGADAEVIRQALSRDVHGNASGPLGRVLDIIAGKDHGKV